VTDLESESLKERVIGEIDGMRERLIEMAATVHANPEIGYQEYQTAQLYTDALEKAGFTLITGVAGLPTAFKASCQGRQGGPTVAFLAELDALPGVGHACGHNIIGTASVGAAMALRTFMPTIPGTIVVFGTPAEEAAVDDAGGKVRMLAEIKEADAAMLVHPSTTNTVRARNVCREALKIEFHGKAAHAGAVPHLGVNALDAAVNAFNLINALRQHVTSDVRIHGIISHGGDSPNVVPAYAAIKLYVRAPRREALAAAVERVTNCARGAALGTGTTVEVHSYAARYLNMVSNPTLAHLFQQNWEQLGLTIEEPPERSYGSTDMGNVSQELPALHPYIAIAPAGTPGHSDAFREAARSMKAQEGLISAAKGLAMTAVDLFTRPDQVKQMQRDFEAFKTGSFIDY
jgi:amidohydrolase